MLLTVAILGSSVLDLGCFERVTDFQMQQSSTVAQSHRAGYSVTCLNNAANSKKHLLNPAGET